MTGRSSDFTSLRAAAPLPARVRQTEPPARSPTLARCATKSSPGARARVVAPARPSATARYAAARPSGTLHARSVEGCYGVTVGQPRPPNTATDRDGCKPAAMETRAESPGEQSRVVPFTSLVVAIGGDGRMPSTAGPPPGGEPRVHQRPASSRRNRRPSANSEPPPAKVTRSPAVGPSGRGTSVGRAAEGRFLPRFPTVRHAVAAIAVSGSRFGRTPDSIPGAKLRSRV